MTVVAGDERVAVAGTGIGPSRVPHLVEVQGRRLTIELEPYVTIFRYDDLPGMIGRVGTIFGAHGINISSAAVGHTSRRAGRRRRAARRRRASARRWSSRPTRRCPGGRVEIVALEGFLDGWSVALG